MPFKQITNYFTPIPRIIFIIDGIGALLSAFLLGIVLVHWQKHVGIPTTTLYFLATLPCFFALYDFYVYIKIKKNLPKFIKVIAIANLLYCLISLLLVSNHYKSVTLLGWFYIIMEIIIILLLAYLEIKLKNSVANNMQA